MGGVAATAHIDNRYLDPALQDATYNNGCL